jgi:hypothetical protein
MMLVNATVRGLVSRPAQYTLGTLRTAVSVLAICSKVAQSVKSLGTGWTARVLLPAVAEISNISSNFRPGPGYVSLRN